MSDKKLWAGRFSEATEKIVEHFNSSIEVDKVLAIKDIKGSIAHVNMLLKQGILSVEDAEAITLGLETIYQEITSGSFKYEIQDEDIHMAIEKRLTNLIGEAGGKLHTARSRNDQVAVDFKLYLKENIILINELIKKFMIIIIEKAEKNLDVIMPGFTHLQTAQPILFSHYIMAYFQMLRRDYERFNSCLDRIDYSPLGAGALAGTTFPIDRFATALELGFRAPTENSIDSVSDRDYALELISDCAIIMMHLSRFAEEIIIFSSQQFSFFTLSDGFCTGSSIMPQKKNPDIPELIRGKSGSVYGSLISLLVTMKALPLAYNKDMQEDKKTVFETLETIKGSIKIFTEMLEKMSLNKEKMYESASHGYSTATDLADYLTKKGIPFRESHHIVGSTVKYAEKKGLMLQELTIEELKQFSSIIDEDVYEFITIEACINNRDSYGGTSVKAVKTQIENAKNFIKEISI